MQWTPQMIFHIMTQKIKQPLSNVYPQYGAFILVLLINSEMIASDVVSKTGHKQHLQTSWTSLKPLSLNTRS
jgi:hypothetical protein